MESILKEINEYGTVTYKRMYGDFTDERLQEWNKKALEYSIVPIQQPRYSKAKNAADIMLVIDAMDILYAGKVEGFCIVSNDSDFTRLVNRLREEGIEVIGMGKSDASATLKAACSEFKNLEILDQDEIKTGEPVSAKVQTTVDPAKIRQAVFDIISKNENRGKDTGLGEVGSQLTRSYSDFDVRNYGYNSLTTFLEDMEEFEIVRNQKTTFIKKAKQITPKKELEEYIISLVRKEAVDLGRMGQHVHGRFPKFKAQDYGYAKFESFISSISEIRIEEKKNKINKVVMLKE